MTNTVVVWHMKWIAPPAGMSKINVDAAVAKSAVKGAVGAVCRANDGSFLGASAMSTRALLTLGV